MSLDVSHPAIKAGDESCVRVQVGYRGGGAASGASSSLFPKMVDGGSEISAPPLPNSSLLS